MTTQTQLRRQCRSARKALTPSQQRAHALRATRLLLRHPSMQRAKRIALFLSTDGELDTRIAICRLWQLGRKIYLPTLTPFQRHPMRFVPYLPQSRMHANRFGILEPKTSPRNWHSGTQMDAVLVPLACFNESGQRIGMGGGYYDRTFAFRKRLHPFGARPALIGWAHECQKVTGIVSQPWDVPLDALITEKKSYQFRT